MSMLHVVSELEVLLMIKPSFPRYAADVFQLKDENIEDETTSLMSLIIEDSIVNLSCVFIFLLVNWIDPDGSHFKLFDNG
ncbi:hypothetical protein LINPERHAP2_LOCUS2654 [Linum perenne]